LPIANKIKLNKKRKINPFGHDEDDMQALQANKKHAKFLLIAPRGLGQEDAR